MKVLKIFITPVLCVLMLATVGLAETENNNRQGKMAVDNAIVTKMFSMYGFDKDVYEIDLLNNPMKTAEVNPDNIAIQPLSQKEPLGLFTVIVKIYENGEEYESGQVRMRIKKYADVLVATERLKKSDDLTPDNLSLKRMDITTEVEKPITSFDELIGYRARRNVSRGKILTAGAIEPIPDIERGREVQIVYSDGLCRITTSGIALQTGMAGEYLKIKNKSTGKIIIARVVDETAVAVDP